MSDNRKQARELRNRLNNSRPMAEMYILNSDQSESICIAKVNAEIAYTVAQHLFKELNTFITVILDPECKNETHMRMDSQGWYEV